MRRSASFVLLSGIAMLGACIPGNRPDRGQFDEAPPPRPTTAYPAEPVATPAAAVPPPFDTRTVLPRATETAASSYLVQAGDTLSRVAEKTGAGSEAIARANDLVPPFVIRSGQRLRVPAGRWHQVRAGETGIAIARAYGVDWSKVAAANGLEPPYILRTGQRLQLPSLGETARMTAEQRAAAFRLDIGDIITGGEPAIAVNATPDKPVKTAPRSTPLPANVAVAAARPFAGRFDWPLTGPVAQGFGPFGRGRRSEGIDIRTRIGTPVYASADGVVAYAGTDIAVYGGLVLIRHSDRWTTAYGHAGELLVTRGQAVKRGQIIARAGETGSADVPLLHFEIRQGAKPVDPLSYLPKRG